MVSLEQIRALEARVEKAVVLIDKLRKENAELEQRLVEISRAEEAARSAATDYERKAASSARSAEEVSSRLNDFEERAKNSEARVADAELKAAEAVEKVQAAERKAQAAEAEAALYRDRALAAERRAAELETKAEDLRKDQSRIEEGLVHALEKLDAFEDLVMGISSAEKAEGSEPRVLEAKNESSTSETAVSASTQTGDDKVEAVEKSPAALASQEPTFPGAENELDIF